MCFWSGIRVFDGDAGGDTATGCEGAFDGHGSGLGGFDQVVEDFVDDGFVEKTFGAVTLQVEFQRFELDTFGVGGVGNDDGTIVGLAGFGTEAGELGAIDKNFVIAVGLRILKRF